MNVLLLWSDGFLIENLIFRMKGTGGFKNFARFD